MQSSFTRRTVLLTTAEASRISDAVTALRTTCATTCMTDYFPDMLQIPDGRCAVRDYHDNHTTGCTNHRTGPPPPYIDATAMLDLGNMLERTVSLACGNPLTGNFDVGTSESSRSGAAPSPINEAAPSPGTCVPFSDDIDAGPWGVCDAGPPDPQPPEAGPDADASLRRAQR